MKLPFQDRNICTCCRRTESRFELYGCPVCGDCAIKIVKGNLRK